MNKIHLLAATSLILGGSLLIAGCGQHSADSSAATQSVPSTPVKATSITNQNLDSAKIGGMCSIDVVSEQSATNDSFPVVPSKAMVFGGWAATADKTNPGRIVLVLKGDENFQASGSTGVQRPDVAKAASSPSLAESGFNFIVNATSLPKGTYKLMVLEPGTKPSTLCDTHKTLVLQ